MSDEELRHLERAARYEGAVADLLACLREGHVPLSLPRQDGAPGPVLNVIQYDYNFAGVRLWMRFCTRCHVAYWGEEGIEKIAAAPMQVRVPLTADELERAGLRMIHEDE